MSIEGEVLMYGVRKSQAAVECADAHLQQWVCWWTPAALVLLSEQQKEPRGREVGTARNWKKAIIRPEIVGRK